MAKLSDLVQRKEVEKQERLTQKQATWDKITTLVDSGTQAIVSSEKGFQEYLQMQAKQPTYSVTNVLAVMMQRPDATQVKYYDAWKKAGRQVRLNEKGIKIFKKNGRGYYDLVPAFDISQTEGKTPPREPKLRDETSEMDKALQSLVAKCPVDIVTHSNSLYEPAEYNPADRKIYIHEDLTDSATFRLLSQEMMHAYMHQSIPNYSHEAFETDAAVASHLLCLRFGVDAKPPDVTELLALYHDMDVHDIRLHLGSIRDVAQDVGDHIKNSIQPPQRVKSEQTYER